MGKGKKEKGKKEKKKSAPEGLDVLNQVDKTFYELQITDLNRKLARLKTINIELEDKNEELEHKYNKIDEDRSDVISYLKRNLQEKHDEITDLKQRVTAMQESSDTEVAEYEVKIVELKDEYKSMREQLTSETKLLTGKLNALEEFRMQRDELMQKFEEQEKNIEEHEINHKKTLYDIEKKFILGKDAIKKEMEKQLYELSLTFERANDMRIAATTQRVIRENITLNNEMNVIVITNERLEKEVYDLKTRNKNLQLNCELFTTERNKCLNESRIQRGVIEQLTREHKKLSDILEENKVSIERAQQQHQQYKDTLQNDETLKHKIRVLEQNLHATRCQEMALQTKVNTMNSYMNNCHNVMLEAIIVIKSAMMIHSDPDLTESMKQSKRDNLLSNLLILLTQSKEPAEPRKSLETIPSLTAMYAKGDLGFIPKVHTQKRPPPLKYNTDTQVGKSFEELLKSEPVETSEIFSSSSEMDEDEPSEIFGDMEDEAVSTTPRPSVAGEVSSDSGRKSKSVVLDVGVEEIEEEQLEEQSMHEEEMFGEYEYEMEGEMCLPYGEHEYEGEEEMMEG